MSAPPVAEPPEPSEPSSTANLTQRATRGALWVAFGYGGAQIIRFVGNLVLTRLLFAEAFGLMALIASVLQGLELFSDIGIGPSIIQNDRADRRFVNTAFTMQAGRGVVLWLIACALSPILADAYDEPALAWMLPLCAVNAVLAGLHNTNLVTLNRDLNLRSVEIVQIGAQVVGFVVMVGWALISPTVLALVAGSLATATARLAMTHLYLPGPRNRFAWDRGAARDLVRFGRWIFVSTVLSFLAGQSDRLVFGALVPMERLGVYSIGMAVAMMPSDVLAKLALSVVFPLHSSIRRGGHEAGDLFERTRRPILVLAGWALTGLIVGGPTAVEILYDERYASAGWVVQLLSLGSWFLVLGSLYGAMLLAHGRPSMVTAGHAAKLLGMAVLIPVGYFVGRDLHPEGDLAGAVAGFALAEMFRYAVSAGAARGLGLHGLRLDRGLTAMVLLVGGAGALGAMWLASVGVHPLLRAALITVVVTLAWAPFGWPYVQRRLKRKVNRGSAA
jgi:O-antigen/teichoic acid export membrane protein